MTSLKRINFKTESELIYPFRKFCKQQYCTEEFYNEVCANGTRKIDSVLVFSHDNNERMAIELKLHLNLKLIEQAYRNKKYVHYSSIVIPSSSINSKNIQMITKICKSLGIGCYTVSNYIPYDKQDELNYDWNESVKILVNPFKEAECKNYNPIKLELFENQKTFCEAGSPSGSSWTPFKETVMNIETFLKENYECGNLVIILKNIHHHYSNPKNGAAVLKKYIKKGIILKDYTISDSGYSITKKN